QLSRREQPASVTQRAAQPEIVRREGVCFTARAHRDVIRRPGADTRYAAQTRDHAGQALRRVKRQFSLLNLPSQCANGRRSRLWNTNLRKVRLRQHFRSREQMGETGMAMSFEWPPECFCQTPRKRRCSLD